MICTNCGSHLNLIKYGLTFSHKCITCEYYVDYKILFNNKKEYWIFLKINNQMYEIDFFDSETNLFKVEFNHETHDITNAKYINFPFFKRTNFIIRNMINISSLKKKLNTILLLKD